MSVTATRFVARSSTASVDTKTVKMALPWVMITLLVVMFNCYLGLLASELLPISFLVNFVEGDPEAAKVEARLIIRYTSGTLLPLMQLMYGFVFFHDPY